MSFMNDAELARHRYSYDPETGEFLWRNPPLKAPKSKTGIGTPAGTIDKRDGNRQVNLDGKIHPAGRVAWLIVHGEWPDGQICYEDPSLPIPARDRLSNLKVGGARQEVTAESLKRILSYDPVEGIFRWLVSRKGTKAGSVAGGIRKTSDGNAYLYIRIDGIDYAGHRLAWLFTYGEWPVTRLTFKNGRPADCRLENLIEGDFEHGTRQTPTIPEDERVIRQAAAQRRSDLKRTFALTADQYQAMHDAQDGKCAICGEAETATRNGRVKWLAVDHSHSGDERIRQLLCAACNISLGLMQDDPTRLRAAAAYLERHARLSEEAA